VSPLQRTLETAAGVFGGAACGESADGGLLMRGQGAAPDERTAHEPVALPPGGPPFVACEQCRERVGASRKAQAGIDVCTGSCSTCLQATVAGRRRGAHLQVRSEAKAPAVPHTVAAARGKAFAPVLSKPLQCTAACRHLQLYSLDRHVYSQ
jgi:hypothetical protein